MKKILITGFSGFVGRHFLDYLYGKGEECEVLGVDIFTDITGFSRSDFAR